MEFRLKTRDHPDPEIQRAGIPPTDPYVEICWGARLRPRTVRLLNCAAELTRYYDPVLSDQSLWEELGDDPAGSGVRSRLLGTAFLEAHMQGLGSESTSRQAFTFYRAIPLVPTHDLDRLHDVQLAHHVQTVREVNEQLETAGYPPVDLPDWVYWRAGCEDQRPYLEDVRDALFARGLPSWPPTPGPLSQDADDMVAASPGAAFVERLDALDRQTPEAPGSSL